MKILIRGLILYPCILLMIACASPRSIGPKESYVSACDILNSELLKVQHISVTIINNPRIESLPEGYTANNYAFNYEERSKYVNSNYDNLVKSVEVFKLQAPGFETRFKDDVKIVETLFYLALTMPGSIAKQDFENTARALIEPNFILNVENETIESFGNIESFKFFFDPKMWDEVGDSLMADMVRENDLDSLFVEALVGVAFFNALDIETANSWISDYKHLLTKVHLERLQGTIKAAIDLKSKMSE